MKVCVVGGGAREHALALTLARSADVIATPGNPGISGRVGSHVVTSRPVPPEEIDADLYVIGPEGPLVEGLADRLRAAGKLVFGPSRAGARLEGSKRFLKEVVTAAGVPTARWASFGEEQLAQARSFLRQLEGGYVIKTDGLAAGKGVLVTTDRDEAEQDLAAKLSGSAFAGAGRRVVIEERLEGEEVSVFAVCDGERVVPLSPAQDYKRIGSGDVGPNTGGMGAYSPVPAVSERVLSEVADTIVEPTLSTLRREGVEYRGLLYAGLMLTADGPKLIEFNVRFGDPETEVVLPRLTSDLTSLLSAAAAGRLDEGAFDPPRFSDEAAVCVVAAAAGYPGEVRLGDPILGTDEAASFGDVFVFHAGTARRGDGTLETAGGRVLCVSAVGPDFAKARRRAYEAMELISFEGMQVRDDIAARPLVKDPRGT